MLKTCINLLAVFLLVSLCSCGVKRQEDAIAPTNPSIQRQLSETKNIIPNIQPVLTTGNNIPVSISDAANRWLEGDTEGAQFTPADVPDDIPISAERAMQISGINTLSRLTQPPVKTTVEFLTYTNPLENVQGKTVWRVIYWGSPVHIDPPPTLGSNGKTVYIAPQPSTNRHAITIVLVDALSGSPFSLSSTE